MPRGRRVPAPSTTQFIALLRALSLAVGAFGISHAQIERRLCGRIAEGQKAMALLREGASDDDAEELRRLIAMKTATEESGLARTDGRRDKAGGQRIGELLAGKFPRGVMPSRRRAEVCFDVLLEILEEKDPAGYADGRYGTREHWYELWLQADQGNMPTLDPAATTVSGYLDVAMKQLAGLAQLDEASDDEMVTLIQPRASTETSSRAARPRRRTDELDQALAEARWEADQRVAEAVAARDDALRRAEAAEHGLSAVESEISQLRKELELRRRANARWQTTSVALAAALVAGIVGGLVLLITGAIGGRSTHTVQLAAAAQELSPDRQATFVFRPPLPADRDWALRIQLTITPTDQSSGCTYGAQVTFHAEADGQALPEFTSAPGQVTIVQEVPLGHRGTRDLRLIVTRLATDPECLLRFSPEGSQASATM